MPVIPKSGIGFHCSTNRSCVGAGTVELKVAWPVLMLQSAVNALADLLVWGKLCKAPPIGALLLHLVLCNPCVIVVVT